MSSEIAEKMAIEFNSIRFENPGLSRLSAFRFVAMTNHGYTFEQLRNTPTKDFKPLSVLRKKVRLFNIYKAKLLDVIAKNSSESDIKTDVLAEV